MFAIIEKIPSQAKYQFTSVPLRSTIHSILISLSEKEVWKNVISSIF